MPRPADHPLPANPCRYAIHLITAAALLAGRRKASAVDVEDVSKAYSMFLDVKRSTHVRGVWMCGVV